MVTGILRGPHPIWQKKELSHAQMVDPFWGGSLENECLHLFFSEKHSPLDHVPRRTDNCLFPKLQKRMRSTKVLSGFHLKIGRSKIHKFPTFPATFWRVKRGRMVCIINQRPDGDRLRCPSCYALKGIFFGDPSTHPPRHPPTNPTHPVAVGHIRWHPSSTCRKNHQNISSLKPKMSQEVRINGW